MEFDWKRLIRTFVIREPTICVPMEMEHIGQYVLAVYIPGADAYRISVEIVQKIRADIKKEKDRGVKYMSTQSPRSELFLFPYMPWSLAGQCRSITEDYVRFLFSRRARVELSILRVPIGSWREVVQVDPEPRSSLGNFGTGIRIVHSSGGPV